MKLELLLAVVHNDKAAYYSSLIQSHQANLQLTVPAKGTSHLILNVLGLTENPKSLVMSVVRADQAASLIDLMMAKQPRNGSLQRLKKQVDQLAKGIEKSPLPSFSVTDDKGATLSSGNLSKGLTAISVWSSWNFESQDQQRRLRRIMRSSGGRLSVVSISVDANRKEVERILQRDSIQWQNVTADRLFESPLLLQLGVSNVPDIIVVRDGRIIDRSVTMANLQEKFDQLLK